MGFLVAGLATGVLATLWITSMASISTPSKAAELRDDLPSTSNSTDVDGLRVELARAKAELDRERARSSRADVDAPVATATEPAAMETPRARSLMAELDRAIMSGALKKRFENDDDGLLELLIDSWCRADDPVTALALARDFHAQGMALPDVFTIGELLKAKGQTDLAADAWILGLQVNSNAAISQLLEVAPERALKALEGLASSLQPEEVACGKIQLLAKLGRKDDAFRSLEQLQQLASVPPEVWERLIECDAEETQKRLTSCIARTEGSAERHQFEYYLADALAKLGRTEEATKLLESSLANEFDASILAKLAQVSRERALNLLQERVRTNPSDGERWAYLGSQLVEAGRHAEAYDALERSYRSGERGWSDAILKADPVRGARLLEEAARQERDDEALGDIADALWQAGRKESALGYWREASRLDPEDSEWTEKLKAVREGRDPLQG
ncbi:MAG: hypothetical protein KDC95_15860 [Planctomycetes bacterium]|nr:hypothetical protein [Planctomycetota bacterium]